MESWIRWGFVVSGRVLLTICNRQGLNQLFVCLLREAMLGTRHFKGFLLMTLLGFRVFY